MSEVAATVSTSWTQLRAVRAALARVEFRGMLKAHLDHCIEAAIVSGDAHEQRRKASELITLLELKREMRRTPPAKAVLLTCPGDDLGRACLG